MAEILNTLGNIAGTATKAATSALNPLALLGSAVGAVGSYFTNKQRMNFEQEEAEKQRTWNEQMMDKENAWSLDMWNRTNEYNSPAAQLQRMKEAGLNPLYYGLDGSSANGMQSAQALGYDRASAPNLENPLANVSSTYMQGKALQKDIEMKNAQIDKIKADTASVGLDNEWKDKTMEARVKAEDLKNELTKEQKAKITDERKQIAENIKKTIAETDNEYAKGFLIAAQTRVSNAQADEIAALMPYRQMLMEAQTEAQKASATASYLNAAINQKLLDEGQVDAIIDKAKAEARSANERAALDEFKTSVRTGNVFNPEDYYGARKGMANIFNLLFRGVGTLNEALLGPISGILK